MCVYDDLNCQAISRDIPKSNLNPNLEGGQLSSSRIERVQRMLEGLVRVAETLVVEERHVP